MKTISNTTAANALGERADFERNRGEFAQQWKNAPANYADGAGKARCPHHEPDVSVSVTFSFSGLQQQPASVKQQLSLSTTVPALQNFDLGALVQGILRSVFQLLQPQRDIPAHNVPSSFAAACPHGGNVDKDQGYEAAGWERRDNSSGYTYGAGGGDTDAGGDVDTPDGSNNGGYDLPDGHPPTDDVGGYKPGSGCPVMDKIYGGGDEGAGEELIRLFEADYGDGKGDMSGDDRPGAREISNAVVDAEGDKKNSAGATDLFWGWGQFLDHDLSLSHAEDNPEYIDVPQWDERFDPTGKGDQQLAFNRSEGHMDANGVRQQSNLITPQIDGSNVYGSTKEQEATLRSGEDGKLTLDERGNLPRNEDGFFIAGDGRVNENPLLTSMHTVFAREHNRLADEIKAQNPTWSDDQIFDAARTKNVAIMQSITVNEFLPVLLGDGAPGAGPLGDYKGPTNESTQISNEFSTAAFRFGHTMVSDKLQLIDEFGKTSEISLNEAFFNTAPIDNQGIDDVLRGAADQQAQEMDTELVDSLRDNVITGPGEGGLDVRLDLAALNIQRGRDHGLPSLNDIKRGLGQEPLTGFDDPRLRDGVGEKLASVYDSIEDVDAWVGMLAEVPVKDGLAGETQSAILIEQFCRTRNGDENWYENTHSAYEVEQLNTTTLADVIERNVRGTDLQDYAMLTERHQPGHCA